MKCEWAHKRDTVEKLSVFLTEEKNQKLPPGEMYLSFIEKIEQALLSQ
jgi:hypothetical protein